MTTIEIRAVESVMTLSHVCCACGGTYSGRAGR
jgi:hypothetical protein